MEGQSNEAEDEPNDDEDEVGDNEPDEDEPPGTEQLQTLSDSSASLPAIWGADGRASSFDTGVSSLRGIDPGHQEPQRQTSRRPETSSNLSASTL